MTDRDLVNLVSEAVIAGFRRALPEIMPAVVSAAKIRELPVPAHIKEPNFSSFASKGSGSDGRRLPAEMKRLVETFTTIVRENPDKRIEELTPIVGVDTATLAPIARRAVKRGLVRTTGTRRGTRYRVRPMTGTGSRSGKRAAR